MPKPKRLSPAKAKSLQDMQRERNAKILAESRALLEKTAETTHTFAGWLDIYYGAGEGSGLEKKSLRALASIPATKAQLLEPLEFAPADSPIRKLMTQRLKAFGVTELNGHAKPFVQQLPRQFGSRAES